MLPRPLKKNSSKGSGSGDIPLMPIKPKIDGTSKSGEQYWDKLPSGVKGIIFGYLNYRDAHNLGRTSTYNYEFFKNKEFSFFQKMYDMKYDGKYPDLLRIFNNFVKYGLIPISHTQHSREIAKALGAFSKTHQFSPLDELLKSADFHLLSFLRIIYIHYKTSLESLPSFTESPFFEKRLASFNNIQRLLHVMQNTKAQKLFTSSLYSHLVAECSTIFRILNGNPICITLNKFLSINTADVANNVYNRNVSLPMPANVPTNLQNIRDAVHTFHIGGDSQSDYGSFLKLIEGSDTAKSETEEPTIKSRCTIS